MAVEYPISNIQHSTPLEIGHSLTWPRSLL